MPTRRDFLCAGVLGAAASLCGDFTQLFAVAAPASAGQLIVRSARYIDLESPVSEFKSWITPVDVFFVRNHMSEPFEFDLNSWRLKVSGEVEHPLSLSFAELARFEPGTVSNTLECAGNGRGFYQPHVPGVQWQRGAVGTARFSGVRLREVLQRADIKASGKHVVFLGLDEPPSKVPKFVRSIPLEKAMDVDTLLATRMNGAPLTKHHGYPVRALVPGWIGAASVKWLQEIRVLDHEFEGNFMNPGYRLPNHALSPGADANSADAHVITALNVKSAIFSPTDGATLKAGAVGRIRGAAWAGEADVTKVEVSSDGGKGWQAAQLGPEHAKYCWRLWSLAWKPRASGEVTLMSRATDSSGRVQPMDPFWNPSGYLYNAVDRVSVRVA